MAAAAVASFDPAHKLFASSLPVELYLVGVRRVAYQHKPQQRWCSKRGRASAVVGGATQLASRAAQQSATTAAAEAAAATAATAQSADTAIAAHRSPHSLHACA